MIILKRIYKSLPVFLQSKIRSSYNLLSVIKRLRYLKKKDNKNYKLPWTTIPKPKVINMKAIDSCNSHCQMCNIWKNTGQNDLAPLQFKKILTDELFSEIQHVGVTGGEPTLRDDLVDIYKVLIETIPKLQGVSIITNGIRGDDIFNKIVEINNLCKSQNISFNVMVSLDGVSKTHDKIRGTGGNFESSIKLINKLKSTTDIPLSFGCTISKNNVWEVDDLLRFVKKNNILTRFRIAEHINVLYNENSKVIKKFNADEKYHLQLFFKKLQLTYEKDDTVKRTYQSIIEMLGGGERQIGCPYHRDGVVLGSDGGLLYCAPKSKEIGNALNNSALKIFNSNLKERHRIKKEHCKNCIHDYHAALTYKEYKNNIISDFSKRLVDKHLTILKYKFLLKPFLSSDPNIIFIIGWYGTETVGDKAILGGIYNFYKGKYLNKCKFVIGSLFPFVTKKTVKELKIEAEVIDSTKFDLIKYSASAKEVVMGGGPLMDLDVLSVPLIAFRTANVFKKHTVIFGSGLGPLTIDKHINTVKEILSLSKEIKMRDSFSFKLATEWTTKKNIKMTGDPAVSYIKTISNNVIVEKKNELACFLREWSYEYAREITKIEFEKLKNEFEKGIANKIREIVRNNKIENIKLYSMHNFVVGNDDRDFARYFIEKYFPNENKITYEKKLSTVKNITEAMKSSKMNLCMRFHSVLFANMLDTYFYAIDYTQGGKIFKYLSDNNKMDKLITIQSLIKKENVSTTNKHIR